MFAEACRIRRRKRESSVSPHTPSLPMLYDLNRWKPICPVLGLTTRQNKASCVLTHTLSLCPHSWWAQLSPLRSPSVSIYIYIFLSDVTQTVKQLIMLFDILMCRHLWWCGGDKSYTTSWNKSFFLYILIRICQVRRAYDSSTSLLSL